jgi:hypothetical protein
MRIQGILFAMGIIVVEMLVKRHCLQARALVDEHEFNTLPQGLPLHGIGHAEWVAEEDRENLEQRGN